jgi:eukaryotic-like serine/threonine-protein kinase
MAADPDPASTSGPAGGAAPGTAPGTAPDAARWAGIKRVFESLLEQPAAAREAELAASELDDAARAEVRSLLAHHDQATGLGQAPGFLDDDPAHAALGREVGPFAVGQRLGAWEIVRAIGSGGMGEVFEAKRVDGSFEGRAAIKRLKHGLGSAAVLHRFDLERRALARLAHPHIARLLDAGADAEGLPYFVMEHVDGRPLHEAAAGRPLEARLALFLQLADAVAHAHRHLLVHRDLKPGNVLVDADGRVKLLDFGIAKALDPLEAADAALTAAGPRPFTPQYASPEQVRGEPVSTATDIYSLGVLLYQMLTGVRPTGQRATSVAEVAQAVLQEQPTRPSRLSAAEVLDPQWWQTRKRLEGDLDNILLKALEKAPDQRYVSVDAMAADVRAFLEGRPVSARAAGPLYVAGKFVRRHRLAVAAGALGAVGLVAGLAAALAQGRWLGAFGAAGAAAAAAGLALALLHARRAALARRQAEAHVEALRRLGREVIGGYGELVTHLPGGMQRKAALLATLAGYLEQLLQRSPADAGITAELALVQARLAHLHGRTNFEARPDDAALRHHAARAQALCAAAETAQRVGPELAEAWVLMLGDLAVQAQYAGDLDGAGHRLDEADAVLARARQRHPTEESLAQVEGELGMLRAMWLAGWDRPSRQQPEAALQQLSRVDLVYAGQIDRAQRRGEPPPAYACFQRGTAASNRALLLARQQRFAPARDAAREAVQWREQALALEPHNRTLAGGLAADRNLLAGLSLDLDDPAGALAASAPGWAALERLIAEDPDQATWLSHRRWLAFQHGRALLGTGRPAEALPVLAVSDDWLAPLVASGQAAPRQLVRWARTRRALVQAQRQLGAPSHDLLTAPLAALQRHLAANPADVDAERALAECQAVQAAA